VTIWKWLIVKLYAIYVELAFFQFSKRKNSKLSPRFYSIFLKEKILFIDFAGPFVCYAFMLFLLTSCIVEKNTSFLFF